MSGTVDPKTLKASKDPGPVTLGKSGDRVMVGCKLPNGLVIHHERPTNTFDSNGREVTQYIATGDTLLLLGANSSKVMGGFGITRNVPRDFIEKWLEHNKDYPPVKQNLIFIAGDEASAEDQAEERSDLKTGLERIDPTKPGPKLEPLKAD